MDAVKRRIRDVAQFTGGSPLEAIEAVERFDWRERQAKWITAATRTHEITGLDWWMPFWDAECVDFWLNTSFKQRKSRSFQPEAVQSIYERSADDPVGHTAVQSKMDWIKQKGRSTSLSPLFESAYLRLYQPLQEYLIDSSPDSAEDVYWNTEYRFGILPLEEFKELYDGQMDHRAYRAKALLGKIELLNTNHPVEELDSRSGDQT